MQAVVGPSLATGPEYSLAKFLSDNVSSSSGLVCYVDGRLNMMKKFMLSKMAYGMSPQ